MTTLTTQLATYLYFKGDCEAALAFYHECFGVVVDRFGIQWIINCEGGDQPS